MNYVQDNCMENIIITGDLNIVLDPKLDSSNYININNSKNREGFLNLNVDYGLIDCFRCLYPNVKKYTWRRKSPIKQARLDYFLISNHMLDIVTGSSILPSYRSDHSPIELSFKLNTFKKGNGVWKFNTSLLKNMSYINIINNCIKDELVNYILPVYNLEKIDEIPVNQLHFRINPNLFLEVLFLRMRRETITFSAKLKREKVNKEGNGLLREIELLESGNLQLNSNLLDLKKQELESLRLGEVKR